jgi:predicted aconitase
VSSGARSASSRRWGLIKSIERAGCYIVDDDFMIVHPLVAQSDVLDRR